MIKCSIFKSCVSPFRNAQEIIPILGAVTEIIIFLLEQEICMLDIDSVKLELQTEVYFSYTYKYYSIEIYIENYKKKTCL